MQYWTRAEDVELVKLYSQRHDIPEGYEDWTAWFGILSLHVADHQRMGYTLSTATVQNAGMKYTEATLRYLRDAASSPEVCATLASEGPDKCFDWHTCGHVAGRKVMKGFWFPGDLTLTRATELAACASGTTVPA